eukprot:3370310-Lingulodinium_polyedra.AAC.1
MRLFCPACRSRGPDQGVRNGYGYGFAYLGGVGADPCAGRAVVGDGAFAVRLGVASMIELNLGSCLRGPA